MYFPDIPTRLILTNIDKLDLWNPGDLSGILISKHPLEKLKEAKTLFDFRDGIVKSTHLRRRKHTKYYTRCMDVINMYRYSGGSGDAHKE